MTLSFLRDSKAVTLLVFNLFTVQLYKSVTWLPTITERMVGFRDSGNKSLT